MKIGHGLETDTQLGPLISQQQLERVSAYVEGGHAQGARTAGSARQPNIEGYYYPPTVLVNTRPDMQVVREEIFGPVVVAAPFGDEDLEDLAGTANDTEFGLFAGIWTSDVGRALRLAKRIKTGSVSINAHMVNEPALPFGGFKQSGWGRERGKEVLEIYTELQSVAVKLG
jgi:phenylacetaldehyde dehydrogenase